MESFNLETIEDNVHVEGSITVRGTLIQKAVFMDEYPKRISWGVANPYNHKREGEVDTYYDVDIAEDQDIRYLVLLSDPKARQRFRKMKPPAAHLMCLQKISTEVMYFRRASLAMFWGHAESLASHTITTLELF